MSLLPASMELRAPTHPALSEKEFRVAMGSLAASVSVVAVAHKGQRLGRTVTSLFSLSLAPPTVLVSINMMSRMADLVVRSGRFSIAILAQDQQSVGDAFAGRYGEMDRFNFGTWRQWPSGTPLLEGAATLMDCELVGSMEAAGHLLLAGTPIEAEVSNRQPLLWHNRDYQSLAPLG